MEHFVPISSFDYYDTDGYYYKAVVVKNSRNSTTDELYTHLVHKQVQLGNKILEVHSIQYGYFDERHNVVKEIKKDEPIVLIVRNKQRLFSLTARIHPKLLRLWRRYQHRSMSSVRVMVYGVLLMGLIFLTVVAVAGWIGT